MMDTVVYSNIQNFLDIADILKPVNKKWVKASHTRPEIKILRTGNIKDMYIHAVKTRNMSFLRFLFLYGYNRKYRVIMNYGFEAIGMYGDPKLLKNFISFTSGYPYDYFYGMKLMDTSLPTEDSSDLRLRYYTYEDMGPFSGYLPYSASNYFDHVVSGSIITLNLNMLEWCIHHSYKMSYKRYIIEVIKKSLNPHQHTESDMTRMLDLFHRNNLFLKYSSIYSIFRETDLTDYHRNIIEFITSDTNNAVAKIIMPFRLPAKSELRTVIGIKTPYDRDFNRIKYRLILWGQDILGKIYDFFPEVIKQNKWIEKDYESYRSIISSPDTLIFKDTYAKKVWQNYFSVFQRQHLSYDIIHSILVGSISSFNAYYIQYAEKLLDRYNNKPIVSQITSEPIILKDKDDRDRYIERQSLYHAPKLRYHRKRSNRKSIHKGKGKNKSYRLRY